MKHKGALLFALVCVFVFIMSCVPQKKADPPPRGITTPVVVDGVTFDKMVYLYGFTFFFPEGSTKAQRTLCLMGATEQLRVFEHHWHAKSKRTSVYLFPTKTVRCGDREGRFWGCCHRPNGPIFVIMGEYYTSSVFYHELVHLNETGKEHDDPKWESFWIPTQWKLWKRLKEEHKELLE